MATRDHDMHVNGRNVKVVGVSDTPVSTGTTGDILVNGKKLGIWTKVVVKGVGKFNAECTACPGAGTTPGSRIAYNGRDSAQEAVEGLVRKLVLAGQMPTL